MGSEAEPAKLLLPYLQRADELQKHDPLVAYYCRLYAMEQGLSIPQKDRTKTTNALLFSLMKQLEKDKKSLKIGPEDNLYVEGFASNLFAKADKQDRASRADLNTAKTFYAASIFFEILHQFDRAKKKYAVWKAADIRKALKEGRKPEPGPPGGDADLSISSSPNDLQPSSDCFESSQQVGHAPYQHIDESLGRSVSSTNYRSADIPPQYVDEVNSHSYDYPTDIHHQPTSSSPEYSTYTQQYEHHSYGNEHQSMPQNSCSPGNSSSNFSYPNFQSYPTFHDTALPSVPTHFHDADLPSVPTHQPYYHAPDSASTHQPTTPYAPPMKHSSGNANQNHVVQAASSAEKYKYDSNYQPSAEKITEAHKAARFAVGALAFDDVAVAVDYLRRSLELLTKPTS